MLSFLPPPTLRHNRWPFPSPVSQQAGMADGQQPEGHWASNGQEHGENGYSAYSSAYRENGYHGGGAAAHPGTSGRRAVCLRACAKACACKVVSMALIGLLAHTIRWVYSCEDCDWLHHAGQEQSIPWRHLNKLKCWTWTVCCSCVNKGRRTLGKVQWWLSGGCKIGDSHRVLSGRISSTRLTK